MTTGNFEAGSVTTVVLDAGFTADKIVDQALFNKMFSEEAYISLLFSKQAFINNIRSIVVTATLERLQREKIGGFQIGTHEVGSFCLLVDWDESIRCWNENGSGHLDQTALGSIGK